jgi:hypothetical protein
MSNRAKKISELTTANTITDNDYFILVANVAGTLTTRKLTVSTFRDTVTFPNYANATYAGIVKIGSQLAVNQDGLLSANIRAANTSSYGTVKIGSELAIDPNGFLISNVAHATTDHTGVVAVGNNLTINATGFLSANIFIANTTVLGKVGVGDQLVINATGFLSANLRYANTTSQGVVKVGNNMTVNGSGFMSAVFPIANSTSPGMVSVAETLTITPEGALGVNVVFANTSTPGVIVVGEQLHIDDETYQLSANIRIANTTSAGIIKVGSNMVIDANGFLTANVEAASVGSASQLESNGFVVSISASNGALELPGTNNQISTATNFIKVVSEGVVQIKSDDVDAGFNYVTIGAERANSAYITILDDSNIYNWKFDKAGITTMPRHIIIPQGDLALSIGNSTVNTTVNSISINTRSNTGYSLNWANNSVERYVRISNSSVVLGVDNPTAEPTTLVLSSNNISLRAQEGEGSGTWVFKANGTILFPDNTLQNTAFMYRTDPPTAPDAVGIKGEFAIDNDYFYVCAGDGAWKRIAYDNTWV